MTTPDKMGSQFDDYMQPHWDEHGQGMLFSPEVGTGLHTDPVSRDRRLRMLKNMTSTMTGKSLRENVVKHINESTVPLSDIKIVSDSGVQIKSHTPEESEHTGFFGLYKSGRGEISIRNDARESAFSKFNLGEMSPNRLKVTAIHEFGHAVHISKNPTVFGSSRIDGNSGYLEGIADGYTRRHAYPEMPIGGASTFSKYPRFFREHEQSMKERADAWNDNYKAISESEIFGTIVKDRKREAIENNRIYKYMYGHVGSGGDIPFATESTVIRGLGLRPNKRARGKQRRLPGVDW